MASWSAAHLLFALAALAPAPTDAFVSSTSLSHLAPRGLASPGLLSLKAKTFQPNELGVNINGPPNAQGSFGRVYFGKQGLFGGQVVVKIPFQDNFGLTTFGTERFLNEKLDAVFPGGGGFAKYLGDVAIDPATAAAQGLGEYGIVFKKEGAETLEHLLVSGQAAGKLGARAGGLVNDALCKKVMADLLGACAQIHSAGVFHRDIKPENCIVAGGQLKLIDFGAGCDIASKTGLNDISIDPFYAPPEKRINPSAPEKFDVYCVGLTGMRCLLPSLCNDPRPGIDQRDPNAVTLIGEFNEVDFPRAGCSLAKWGQNVMSGRDPTLQAEVAELFSGRYDPLLEVLGAMTAKQALTRPEAQAALAALKRC